MKKQTTKTDAAAIAGSNMLASSTLFKRKGKLIISRQLILEADENTLREIFSNFFPMATEPSHQFQYWDSILYYGVSPHFEEVEEACVAPEYDAFLKSSENGIIKFECFKKRELYCR